ncbi:MAG: type I glyceraldehyde-3-phosphate dehydrogenase [Candidatus Pacebacteria bacterium]|nr:type I glyceraldehyde-3-phosphate dehydrogenase [Candidatus Paceibacterota bacterium]
MKKNKKIRVAINGFGRIGRAFYRAVYSGQFLADSNIEIVAINDLGDKENLEYLLKHDSVYGKFDGDLFNVKFLQEREPSNLPWGEIDIDVVVECTGFFRTQELAQGHIDAGAKRVVISAPSADATTVLMGVNEEALNTCKISSNASCTTNATSPVIGILDETIGIEKAILNTVHGYTATQSTVDSPVRQAHGKQADFRRGRAAAINIIPTSTGAAKATTLAHTQLTDKFDGIAVRVPVPAGSIVDITFIAKRGTTVEEVNEILKKAIDDYKWSMVFGVTDEPLVSTDILGDTRASIADLSMTRVVDDNLVKVLAWYDNETGYANSLVQHVLATKAPVS